MAWSSLGMTLAMILLAITEVFKTDMENELHEVPLYLTILLVFGSSTFIMFHGISKKTCLKKIEQVHSKYRIEESTILNIIRHYTMMFGILQYFLIISVGLKQNTRF